MKEHEWETKNVLEDISTKQSLYMRIKHFTSVICRWRGGGPEQRDCEARGKKKKKGILVKLHTLHGHTKRTGKLSTAISSNYRQLIWEANICVMICSLSENRMEKRIRRSKTRGRGQ